MNTKHDRNEWANCSEWAREAIRAQDAEIARLRDTAHKAAKWCDMLAANSKRSAAAAPNLPAFADACRRDAENYTATAKSIRAALTEPAA